jgi:hypothetical protein
MKEPPKEDSLTVQEYTLYRRLEDGDKRIEQARMRGEDVTAWEDFWIDLLHQYEAVCDKRKERGY